VIPKISSEHDKLNTKCPLYLRNYFRHFGTQLLLSSTRRNIRCVLNKNQDCRYLRSLHVVGRSDRIVPINRHLEVNILLVSQLLEDAADGLGIDFQVVQRAWRRIVG